MFRSNAFIGSHPIRSERKSARDANPGPQIKRVEGQCGQEGPSTAPR